jgi:hypothetical protein
MIDIDHVLTLLTGARTEEARAAQERSGFVTPCSAHHC